MYNNICMYVYIYIFTLKIIKILDENANVHPTKYHKIYKIHLNPPISGQTFNPAVFRTSARRCNGYDQVWVRRSVSPPFA